MRVFAVNQYDRLERCILVYPSYLQVTDQQTTHEIDLKTASKQYNVLVNTLIEFGVKVFFLDINGGPSQLFARDIGFVIGDLLLISNMKKEQRKAEVEELKQYALRQGIKHYMMQNEAEGGDIIVHHQKVFVGQGDRTNHAALMEIDSVLEANKMQYELVPVSFHADKIHLDCVFNILDANTCVVSEDLYNIDEVKRHFARVIEAEPQEERQFLATNIVNIGSNTTLCSSEKFTNVLRQYGYNAIFIPFDEIIKDKGSLGCCVLPMVRQANTNSI